MKKIRLQKDVEGIVAKVSDLKMVKVPMRLLYTQDETGTTLSIGIQSFDTQISVPMDWLKGN